MKARLSPNQVGDALRHFLDGTAGDWDWDDFTSIPLADPALDAIRREANAIELPVDEEGRAELIALIARAEMLADERQRVGTGSAPE